MDRGLHEITQNSNILLISMSLSAYKNVGLYVLYSGLTSLTTYTTINLI